MLADNSGRLSILAKVAALILNIPFIAAATALLIGASIAKVFADQPKKADKSQKGEILKQLLALSEGEGKVSGASSVRLRTSVPNQGRPAVNRPQNTSTKIPQRARSGK